MLRASDGKVVSPYRVTCALERLSGVERYQVIQTEPNAFTVKVRSAAGPSRVLEQSIVREMQSAVGTEVEVAVAWDRLSDGPRGNKFRVVQSLVNRQTV